MAISTNAADNEKYKFVESNSVPGQPGVVVVNPDGTDISGTSASPSISGLEYNATPPELADGGVDALQGDENANQYIRETYAPGYEDNTNNKAVVEHRYSYTKMTADTQVKASAGFIHTVTFSQTDAAPTAGSITIYDNTAESGTAIFEHTFDTTAFRPFTITLDVTTGTGIYVGFNTTADVSVTMSWR